RAAGAPTLGAAERTDMAGQEGISWAASSPMRASLTGWPARPADMSASSSGTTGGSPRLRRLNPGPGPAPTERAAATRGRRGAAALGVRDAPGTRLLRGLIDCHAHYTMAARLEVADGILDALHADPATAAFIGARNAALALNGGVTTARSAGAAHSRDIPLR